MKRNKKVGHRYLIRPIWPILFWSECCNCKKEFRRKWLWITRTISETHGIHGIADYEYLCKNCAPTYSKACDIFSELYEIRSK